MAGHGLSVTWESWDSGYEHPLVFLSTALCLLKLEHGKVERTLPEMEFWLHACISLFLALGTWAKATEHL